MNRRRAQTPVSWIIAAGVVALVLAGMGWLMFVLAMPQVTVTDVVEGPVVQAFYSTGTVQPEREFPVKSNIAGIITEVSIDKGDHVKAGQALAVVSDPELIFAARKAAAEREERQKRADAKTSPVLQEFDARIEAMGTLVEMAQREEARIRKLIESQSGSPTDLDRATDRLKTVWSQHESLKAQRGAKKLELERELAVAKSALDTANWNLEQQTLKSPVDGVVLDRPLTVGTRVAINDRLLRVADVRPEKLVMRAAVDEEDIAKVKVGQTVRMSLYAFADRLFAGKVAKIYDEADATRRTFEVDVQFDEIEKQLASGMTGELAFILAQRAKTTVVPSQAIQNGSLWVVAGGKLSKRQANAGVGSIERTEITSGIKPGEKVVISPIGDLQEGQRVRIKFMDPIAAAGLNKKEVEEQPFKAFD
jgi:multidrug efflux pump subunit AcrA (membrane-fusion protein)